jgi:hypothetical protein
MADFRPGFDDRVTPAVAAVGISSRSNEIPIRSNIAARVRTLPWSYR